MFSFVTKEVSQFVRDEKKNVDTQTFDLISQ